MSKYLKYNHLEKQYINLYLRQNYKNAIHEHKQILIKHNYSYVKAQNIFMSEHIFIYVCKICVSGNFYV